MNDDTNYTPIEGVVMHMTKKAVLLKVDGEDDVWIPFSVIHEDDCAELEVGEYMEINVAEWFCEKEGL